MSSVLDRTGESADALLAELRQLDIRIDLDDGALRVRGAKSRLSPALAARIQSCREELIAFLRRMQGAPPGTVIPKRDPTVPLQLSFIQRNLWLIDQLEGSVHYNMAVALEAKGDLDAASLERALTTLIERHESLRTVFRVDAAGTPHQVILERFDFHLQRLDLSGLEGNALEQEARRCTTLEARKPFDLAQDLMMRASLLTLGPARHVLLLTKHHIASDGWSMDVLLDEMSRLYAAFSQGQANPLPPLPIQYADYSAWLSEWLQGPVLEAKVDYWKRQLDALPALHSLPLDRPRSPYRSIVGGRHSVRYPMARYRGLMELARQHEVTLFVLLEAAYAVFLSRWSGEQDVVVATPISSRSRPELASLIGYFTNTLVLRSDCGGDLSFVQFLRQSRQMVLDAQEHHHVPFEVLVDRINPARSLAYNALAQVSFTLQNNRAASMGAIELPGVRFTSFGENEHALLKFDLDLTIREDSDGLLAKWEFSSDIFERSTIERMDRHFAVLLDSILADPEQSLRRLALVPEEDAAQLAAWNATAVDLPQQDTLESLFRAQAARTPEAVAVLHDGGAMSYAELDAKSDRLAARLARDHGIGVGSRVGHCFERSPDMMVAVLAILKIGAAYVALDPGLPTARLAYMLEDSEVSLVLTLSTLMDRFRSVDSVQWLALSPALDSEDLAAPGTAMARPGPDDPAYIIYTSGSTGRPKGTVTLHRAICNRLHAMQAQFALDAKDRVLQKTPLSFDVSVWEMFWPIATGATLVLAAPEAHGDPDYLARLIADRHISVVHFVPSMLQSFVTHARGQEFPRLRYLITSGEALGYELQAQCIEHFPRVRKINQYGPTEAAIDVTWWSFDALRPDRIVPIGRPAANVRIHILDPLGQQVPVGVAGELFIGGVQVGAGYLNNPVLTAERFVHRDVAGRREYLYQTGDAARWLADGEIEYLGRLDHQVKLRGFRIELGEIEACLEAVPGVAQSAVILWDGDGPGHERLVAYWVPVHGGACPDAEQLRSLLRGQLPDFMLPSHFVELAALPLTRSGKLDRRALPAPVLSDDAADQAASTPTEELLAGIWADVLRRDPPGGTANFFALGGHSLLATQLASAIRRHFDVEMPLRVVFERPTLREQADWLAQQQRGYAHPTIEPVPAGQHVLSFAQQRLWLLSRLQDAGTAYNIPRALALLGPLDRPALTRAFERVVQRHSSLRLSFPQRGDQAAVVLREPYSPLRFQQIEDGCAEARAALVQARVEAHARSEFDLDAGPLLLVDLLQLEPAHHILLVNMHHIISDGWSIGVMMREVSLLYTAYRDGREDPLPALAVQYPDYARWQRDWLAGGPLMAQLDYWRQQLADVPSVLALPLDRTRPAQFSYRGAHYCAMLDAPLRDAVARLSRSHGCTAFMTVLAAFKVLLARYSGQDDVCVGTPIANRTHHQTESMIGCFVNTLVLRSRIDRQKAFSDLLSQVRTIALEAYNHQDIPFERLVEELNPARNLGHSPLFQVMFRYENQGVERVLLPEVTSAEIRSGGHSAKFDLLLNVIECPQGLQCEWEYATDIFDEDTIARMHRHFNTLLGAIVSDNPAVQSMPLCQLPLLDTQERDSLLKPAQRPHAGPVPLPLLHRLFEAQAALRPDAIALSCAGVQWTYAQLNRHANQLAHRLLARGVQPDDRVALCAEHSLELIAGLLGILKAGAGYVAVDPRQPRDRLDWVLRDSTPVCVVSHSSLGGMLPDALPCLWLDDEAAAAGVSAENPEVEGLGPHHLAYVIYTSGSTGRAKGVQVEHRQVSRLLSATEGWFGFGERDVWTLFHSYAFDFSVWEIWGALAYGGRLVVVNADVARSPQDFHALLCAEGVTVLNQTPGAFRQLIAADAAADRAHALRLVIFGGEALDPTMLRRWVARNDLERTALVNMYGITETTVHVTYRPLSHQDIFEGRGSMIGRPIPDLRVLILDDQHQPVPVGVVGEMYVGGAGVARGYLGREDLNAQRFIADPFDPGAGRLYRTGDLARWTADNDIEYLGRNDFQVKIRGFRIELGEIEVRLAACPGVADAIVVADTEPTGEQRLLAYLVAEESVEPPTAAMLRSCLSSQLPDYMLPAAYIVMPAFPLTTHGKLDRRALPVPGRGDVARTGYRAPEGARETLLAQVWSELLDLPEVGREDNFFALGGHSFLVVAMLDRLRRSGWHADVRMVFMAAHLAELAAQLRPVDVAPQPVLPMIPAEALQRLASRIAGGSEAIQDAYPLSPMQEGILFHHLLDEGRLGDAYIMRDQIRFDSQDRLRTFLEALQAVVDRHDILRTSMHWDGLSRPLQVVHAQAPLQLTQWEADAAAPALQRMLAATDPAVVRMTLDEAPILRAHAAHDPAADEWVLVLLNHHIVEDEYSRQIKLREVNEILSGRGGELPDARPYRDFVARLQGRDAADHAAYFRAQLGDVDRPTLPFADLAGPTLPTAMDSFRLPLDAALAARIGDVSRQHSATPAVLFHLAWAVVMARCSGSDDVVFGTILSGRLSHAGASEGVVGMFINALPLRLRLADCSVAEALAGVRTALAGLMEHEQAPLALALRCSGVPAPLPLFNAMINYRHSYRPVQVERLRLPGIRVLAGEERSAYPLSLVVEDDGETVEMVVQSALPVAADRLMRYLQAALHGIVDALQEAPDRSVGGLDILGDAERTQLLAGVNQPRSATAATIHARFVEAARQCPAAAAVGDGTRLLSFAALDRLSDRFARRLADAGVRGGDRVALLAERGIEALAGLLGVLKAGAAFVPFDPSYPDDRLQWQFDDCRPSALLHTSDLAHRLDTHGVATIALEEGDDVMAPAVATLPVTGGDPAAAAYLIYTSGSTGRPKGVVVEHRSVLNLWEALDQKIYRHCDMQASIGLNAGLSFDASIQALGQWLCGRCVMVVPSQVRVDAAALVAFVRQHGLQALDCTPTHLEMMIDHGLLADGTPLRALLIGGEPLTQRTWDLVAASPVHGFNVYGPTECTVDATCAAIQQGQAPHIGMPLPNVSAYVLDGRRRLLPMGVVGELHVGGLGVARGYWQRPDLETERFVPDPFAGDAGARMYRTGDLCRWNEGGYLEFLGRNDDQIKLRGHRIELGEVCAVLSEHPDVQEARVVLRTISADDRRLAAYFIARESSRPGSQALRAWMAARLPQPMLPATFTRIDAWPMTANGKLDVAALPDPGAQAGTPSAFEPPIGSTEETIARYWGEVLGRQQVGRNEDFFLLGGHSLLATQLLVRLRAGFDAEIPLALLFQHTTVAAQAGALLDRALADLEPAAHDAGNGAAYEHLTDEQLERLLQGEER